MKITKARTIFIILLFFAIQGNSQEWAKIGSKWYYSNFETYTQGKKEGYVFLESAKDTMINDTIVRKISVYTYYTPFSGGGVVVESPIYTKKDKGKYLYKYISDSTWNVLYDSNWVVGGVYSIKVRDLNNFKSFTFTFAGYTNETVGSQNLKFANLKFDDWLYFHSQNGTLRFNEHFGFEKYFVLSTSYEAVDGHSTGPIRCFNGEINVHFGIKCDSIIYQNIPFPSSISSIIENSVIIFPNPANEMISIEVDSSKKDVFIELYTIEGVMVYKSTFKSNVFSISHLKNGMYLIRLSIGNEIHMLKFCKN